MKASGAFQGQAVGVKDVFYNMLNIINLQAKDERTLHLTQELQQLLKPERFSATADRAMAPGTDKMNLLKVSELNRDELQRLKADGFQELINFPTANIHTFSSNKELLQLAAERADKLNASQFEIKIAMFKTRGGNVGRVPRRFVFKFRFYSFEEHSSPYVGMLYGGDQTQGGIPDIKQQTSYYLQSVASRIPPEDAAERQK